MRDVELQAIEHLRNEALTIPELAEALEKSRSWTFQVVQDLDDANLVDRNDHVEIAETAEASLLTELIDQYDVQKLLKGNKEKILERLLDGQRTVGDLERQGLAKSTVYEHLNEMQETGAITRTDDGYEIADDTLRSFLEARQRSPYEQRLTADGETVVVTSKEDAEGTPTAFSAFTRYGVEYHPNKSYRYQGDDELALEDVLIHAVATASDTKQMAMAAIFALAHQATLDAQRLWRLARQWGCVEAYADLQAYLDQRGVHDEARFLPWEEFTALANEYDVYPRDRYPGSALERGFEELGDALAEETTVYLLGGGNLILRDLKDATKDVDLVVPHEASFERLQAALVELGYEERGELERSYTDLDPSVVLEREGSPRWDVFVETVANKLRLTTAMRERCDQTHRYGDLEVRLIALTDIFLFKAITNREGDLEDAAVIARQGDIDWQQMLREIETQEAETEQYFSFDVLETLDVLAETRDVSAPIRDRLASYCLEHALLETLDDPKTIEELREEFDFPDHQIYNKLRKLEEDGLVEVDRGDGLNQYRRV